MKRPNDRKGKGSCCRFFERYWQCRGLASCDGDDDGDDDGDGGDGDDDAENKCHDTLSKYLGGGFRYLIFNPYLRKIPILTTIFQRGWNHQLG